MPESPRRIDARSLRALAHPLRIRILELLTDDPATATGLAKRLGENTGTVSWHLRHLAEHRFIEEDTERGTKRERWWRTVKEATVLNSEDFRDDPDSKAAYDVYSYELAHALHNSWINYLTQDWEPRWRSASELHRHTELRMTPERLRALNAELAETVERYLPAPDAEPEPGSLPVTVQWQAFPRKEGADG
jgi:DNA-binding transcriptional ArsR family regulator